MKDFCERHFSEFNLESLTQIKGDRKVHVVFSTFGERESELIYEKISLLSRECPELIDSIVLSHRRMENENRESTEEQALRANPDTHVLICNSYTVPDMGDEKGKGADMRRTLYYITKTFHPAHNDVILYLDADVLTEYFGIHFITALAGAVLEGADFAKSSFFREMGRVKKYVAQPLFSVINHEELSDLSGFSYPLSGEVGGTFAFFSKVKFWQMYGVETGVNIDAVMGGYSVVDVNLGFYDHAHSSDINIQKMAFGIIRTYLKKLNELGLISLHKGAVISDTFESSTINEKGERENFSFDLKELQYNPLTTIL
jgi:hypothetical protein